MEFVNYYCFIYIFSIYFLLTIKDQIFITDFCNFTLSFKWLVNSLKYFLILIFLFSLIIILFNHKIEKFLRFEFFYILGFSFIGMILLLISNDLITMFLSLELQTFGLYILIAIQQKRWLVQKLVLSIIF